MSIQKASLQAITDAPRFENRDRQTGVTEWGMAAGKIEVPVLPDGAMSVLVTLYAHVNTATGATRHSVALPSQRKTSGVVALSSQVRQAIQQAADACVSENSAEAVRLLSAAIQRMTAPKPAIAAGESGKAQAKPLTLPTVALATLKTAQGETVAQTVVATTPVESTTNADGHDKSLIAPLTGATGETVVQSDDHAGE